MAATYTVKQVADILGYSTNSIYTFLKEKRIKGVRVGRGRFRIPQGEVDRLLQGSKSAPTQHAVTQAEVTEAISQLVNLPTPTERIAAGGITEQDRVPLLTQLLPGGTHRVDVPSLFDWFSGIASIILGLSMVLFSHVFEEFSIQQFNVWMPAVRIMLIGGGFGLLLTDIVNKKWSAWHRFFHIVLFLGYAAFTFILWQTGDWEGVTIYGILSLIFLLTFFVPIGGIASFAIYAVSFLGFLPVGGLMTVQKSPMASLLSLLPFPGQVAAYTWLGIVLVIAGVLFVGYNQYRRVFWLGMMAVAALLVGVSLHYAQGLYWGRALFTLLIGLVCLVMPMWDSLTFTHKQDRSLVFSIFGTILVIFLAVVGIIRVLESNIIDYAKGDLTNKIMYGKTFISSAIDETKSALEATSQNSLLVTAIGKADATQLTAMSRGLFESNTDLWRVDAVDKLGRVVGTYPYGVNESGNMGLRDYVTQALTTKTPYETETYETQSDGTRRELIVIAVPVIAVDKTVVGVLVGEMDLLSLGTKLQSIAQSKLGEYFVVINKNAKRLIARDREQVGLEVDASDSIRQGLLGNHGVGEGADADGTRSLVAYDGISPIGWAVAVKAPLPAILQTTSAGSVVIFSLIIISMIIIAIFVLAHRMRSTVPPVSPGVESKTPELPNHDQRVSETLAHMKKMRPKIRGDGL